MPRAILVRLAAAVTLAPSQPPVYRDATRPVEARVADLLGRMTLEEKFWQLFMIPGDLDNPSAYRSVRESRPTCVSRSGRSSSGCSIAT